MVEITTGSVEETIELGKHLASLLEGGDVVTLTGDLGAGKTHFTKGVAQGLGVEEEITSPTFPLLLEYEGAKEQLFHFDFYRLESEDQLEDIAWYELSDSGAVVLAEWADMFPDALPDERLDICVSVERDNTRVFHIQGLGNHFEALEDELLPNTAKTSSNFSE